MAVHGLLALLDDVASIAHNVGTLTALAAKKTAGVVTDDMAVTAEQAIGIAREREIPVVLAVARGSMFNKVVILTPGALVLSVVAPWSITPILMAGGAFLCFEGAEKIIHKLFPHGEVEDSGPSPTLDPVAFEKSRVEGAIRTDLILSAEIIALSLGEVAAQTFWIKTAVLYAISVVMTVGVYGVVGGLVKLDDLGELLARRRGPSASLGLLIVRATPTVLKSIGVIGTVAMLLVGGHILLKGIDPLYQWVHHAVESLPAWSHTLVSTLADLGSGFLWGLLLVGIMKTGIPGALWARIAALKRPSPPAA